MAQEIAVSTLLDTWGSGGNIVEPDISKIIEGWQLGEQPPHEYMNWLQNTFGSKLNHILKNGVATWNNETEYLAGSSVQHNGNVWLCKTTNTNSEPADVNANWKRIITVESLTAVLAGYVALTGDQTIAGIKTFSSSPIVPTPTAGTQVANKAYVDASIDLKTIATGTASFTATTNNINLTGIGIGVETGDVIQISGADDAKNNSEFTIEVITDANNIIVNQAHANKGTTKNVATSSGNASVTVKLLIKWYAAPLGLGQGWVSMYSSRQLNTNYKNLTNRAIQVLVTASDNATGSGNAKLYINGQDSAVIADITANQVISSVTATLSKNDEYKVQNSSAGQTISNWSELR